MSAPGLNSELANFCTVFDSYVDSCRLNAQVIQGRKARYAYEIIKCPLDIIEMLFKNGYVRLQRMNGMMRLEFRPACACR